MDAPMEKGGGGQGVKGGEKKEMVNTEGYTGPERRKKKDRRRFAYLKGKDNRAGADRRSQS